MSDSPRFARSPSSPSSRGDTEAADGDHDGDGDDAALEAEEREKARLEAELDAAKDELFGPRRKKRTEDDDEDDTDGQNHDQRHTNGDDDDEPLTDDQLINFDLGELDITTNDDDSLIDFEEIDDDLMHFSQDNLVKEALQKGVDLRIYSATIDTDIQIKEEIVLMDYINNAEELSILYHAAKDVANKLNQANTMLSQFQNELFHVSAEISDLQLNSLTMSNKVKNRTKAQRKLHNFIQTIYIPDDIQQQLVSGDMNSSTYPLALTVLDQHLSYLSHTTLSNTSARAVDDALPQIERTRKTTLKRVTQHLLEQINIMSKPTVNILIHQRSLLKLTPLYAFLAHQHADKRGEESSQQVRDTYSELMSKIFLNKFKKYFTETKKYILENNSFDKTDLLGLIEGKKNSLLKAKKTIQDVNKLFILGSERYKILEGFSIDHIIPLNQLEKGSKLSFEQVYRSAQAMLVESAVSEYDFIVAFFGERERATAPPPVMDDLDDDTETPSREDSKRGTTEEKSQDRTTEHSTNSDNQSSMSHDNISTTNKNNESKEQQNTDDDNNNNNNNTPTSTTPVTSRHNSHSNLLRESDNNHGEQEKSRTYLIKTSRDKQVFVNVFQKTFSFFKEQIDNFIFLTNDPLAILIIIRCINTDMSVLTSQHIHVLDSLFDGLTLMLWPKFKQLFDAHVESITKVPDALVVPTTPKKPAGRGQPVPAASSTDASGGHYVCTRYADFAVSILTLNRVQQDDILTSNLRRMRQEVEKLLSRSAAKLSGKQAVVYLIHQYHALLKILQSTGFESEDSQHFSQLANTQINLFVEEELNEKFGRLIQFVKSFSDEEVNAAGSAATNTTTTEERSVDLVALESIVKHFAKYWKDGIEALHTSVTKCFDPATNGGVTTTTSSGGHEERVGDEILKQVLVQLLRYYQRFQEIIKKYARNKPNITKDVVPTSTIMFEVRKYSQ